jgi:fibronectin-binding autotransporter adhesin
MVGRSLFGSCAALAAGFLLLAAGARAQTAVWDGDGDGTSFEDGANYADGMAPNGSTTVNLPGGGGTIVFNAPDSALGIVFLDGGGQWNLDQGGSGSLTLGSGGMSPQDGETQIIAFFSIPIILAADQTWSGSTSGFIYTSGPISGAYQLTVNGRVYFNDNNTFSGGLVVSNNGTAYFGTDTAAGTGPISVQDGSTLQTFEASVTIANPLTLSDGAALGSDAPADVLTFSGPVTFPDANPTLTIDNSSAVAFTGTVTGQPEGSLTINGSGAQLPVDGGSQLVMTGSLSQFESLSINNAQVILAPTGDPVAALGSLTSSGALQVNSQGYLGLGGTYANAGALSNFLTTYGLALGNTINGSLGLESVGNSGTFTDTIDLTDFTSEGFLGLGTTGNVTITGTILPAGSSSYVFGGGGGVMTVSSALADEDGTSLTMTAAPAPLTLILQGPLSFEGGVTSNGGVLIFDTPTNQSAQSMILSGGYVGYTSAATDIGSPSAFIALLDNEFTPNGVIGFDTTNLASPATITQDINLSTLNEGANVFLGSATSAILASTITITPSANDLYQFTGVKGGIIEVDATLAGAGNSLVIGLPTPIESGGSQSSVTLSGTNTFGGTTTFNSGILNLLSNGALSSSDVYVTDGSNLTLAPVITAPSVAVVIPNNIAFASLNNGHNPGLMLGSPASSMLTLDGNLTDSNPDGGPYGYLDIAGPVTLAGNNTYSGGTVFTGDNPTVTVSSSTAFGTGTVTIQSGGGIIPGVPSVTISNPIVLNANLVLGLNGNDNTINMDGPLTGNGDLTILSPTNFPNANGGYSGEVFIDNTMVTIGNELSLGTGQLYTSNSTVTLGIENPTITNLSGDGESTIALESEATLTLYTPNALEEFDGTISGDSSNSVVKTGAGAEYLTGTSTYGNGTSIDQGTLIAGASGSLGTGQITVYGGGQLGTTSGAVLTNDISLQPGAILSGTGTFSPPGGVAFNGGSAVSPGNNALNVPVGALTFTTGVNFATAGAYDFNLSNASGSAGTGYSTINVSGGLTISATSGMPFVINVATFDSESGQPGQAIFNPALSYNWTILSADSITGFAVNKFTINTGGFQNDTMGGTFSLMEEGSTTLALDFTPVPEPATWALLGGGVLLVGLVVRRRRAA